MVLPEFVGAIVSLRGFKLLMLIAAAPVLVLLGVSCTSHMESGTELTSTGRPASINYRGLESCESRGIVEHLVGGNELDAPQGGGIPLGPEAGFSGAFPRDAIGEAGLFTRSHYEREEYSRIVDNPFLRALENPLSTFSIDVDTAAYANMRRFINDGQLPPPDALRIEEMVNYFRYAYPAPQGAAPFAVSIEVHPAPWQPKHRLVRIGLQAKEISLDSAPACNLVFLVDVSGSMSDLDKLPLVKESLALLVATLRASDRVAIVTYAGESELALPPTTGDRKTDILAAIERLSAGGSTNGGAGIVQAYDLARKHFIAGGINRVILCTDGDFNVGVSSEGELTRLIEEKRRLGVFLSVLGFGRGNLADARMQALADTGNGNAYYIDSIREAKKVLVQQATGTLMTVAKDVKIQVEFNPAKVGSYRLLGYENRMLTKEEFNDDAKDAGEIGAGHQVTALYELVPAGQEPPTGVDDLRYVRPAVLTDASNSDELLTVKLRYKQPDGDTSLLMQVPLKDAQVGAPGDDFRFAASVAAFAMLLRHSLYQGESNLKLVEELAAGSLGHDTERYRAEFVELVKRVRGTSGR